MITVSSNILGVYIYSSLDILQTGICTIQWIWKKTTKHLLHDITLEVNTESVYLNGRRCLSFWVGEV